MRLPFGKTYFKTILREIQGSVGRFLAIFAIVALGVGFLAGLLATTPDMKASADRYFHQSNMMDIFIKGTLGLTDADAEAVRTLENIEELLPGYVIDTMVKTSAEELLVTRIYGLPLDRIDEASFINRMELIEGRMPEHEGECLVQEAGGYLVKMPLGTRLEIPGDSDDTNGDEHEKNDGSLSIDNNTTETYSVKKYTVTGIVKSPLFISYEREPSGTGNGRLGAVMYVYDSCYALPAYTDFFITLKGTSKLATFSDEYERLVDDAAEKIKTLGEGRYAIRRVELLAEARKTGLALLADAETEYENGRKQAEAELAGGRRKLDAAAQEIAAGEAELADGKKRINEGRVHLAEERQRVTAELRDNEAALAQGEREIAAAKQTLAENKAKLDAARDEVEKTRASKTRMSTALGRDGVAQYDAGLAAYQAGLGTVTEKEEELRNGRILLEEGRLRADAEFARAEAELNLAEADIAAGQKRIGEARRELAAGLIEFESGQKTAEAELREGKQKIAEGRQKIDDIEIKSPEWYVLDRNANMGYVDFMMNSEKIADIAKVFPVFFLLVAALVALTTMTRMVEEERIQIGVLKALGYRKRVIAAKYLIYCALTGVFGSAVGMVSGFQGLPVIIYRAFGTRYHLPPLVTEFNWPFGLIACALVLLCTMGATVSASYQALWEKPATLMLPRAPKPGKRIFLEYIPFIWRNMKFTYKVSARNLIRYKKHFIMTVTGIAGCTALMLTGFGLRDSMLDIARTQFSDILKYDLRIEVRDGKDWDSRLTVFLGGSNGNQPMRHIEIHSESGYLIDEKERLSTVLYVPRPGENLGDFISLQNRKTKQPGEFNAESVVVTEKTAEELGVKTGDRIRIENSGGSRGEFILTGITENYVGSMVYIGGEAWRKAFGELSSYPTLFVQTGIDSAPEQDAAIVEILASDTVAGAEFTARTQESYNNLLASISFVVLILILAAGGLAVIVLYNLTNININERSRELATLRVLGFHQGEAAAYIFREITILSIVGTGAGLILGIPLHAFMIGVAETPELMFGRTIAPASFVLSAIFTLLFSAAVDLLMLKKIRNIKMADSMKAVD
ncbi:ABC transporter permease [Spirochaetia bacterium]|nr:ABC transporter permease [Spirochaetia bacterium]